MATNSNMYTKVDVTFIIAVAMGVKNAFGYRITGDSNKNRYAHTGTTDTHQTGSKIARNDGGSVHNTVSSSSGLLLDSGSLKDVMVNDTFKLDKWSTLKSQIPSVPAGSSSKALLISTAAHTVHTTGGKFNTYIVQKKEKKNKRSIMNMWYLNTLSLNKMGGRGGGVKQFITI